MIKIVALSDLHGNLPEDIEPCELVCICGDISPLKIQSNYVKMREWMTKTFKRWAEGLPCDKVLFIAGNHDYLCNNAEWMLNTFKKNDKVTYLFHENYIYTGKDGIEYSFFGTPYCKVFGNWAFMRCDEMLNDLFKDIPENLDFLLTHDAPYGVSDICLQINQWNHLGSVPLREAILDKQPNTNIHGHLHSSSNWGEKLGETTVYNCSILDESYDLIYKPLVINYNKTV